MNQVIAPKYKLDLKPALALPPLVSCSQVVAECSPLPSHFET